MSACIEHTQAGKKYAGTTLNKRSILLHRAVYIRHHGIKREEIEDKVVRHTCDNPRCINPDHLELGTQGENLRDRRVRNRKVKKFRESDVAKIRERLAAGESGAAIARDLGVAHGTIYGIKSGRYWALPEGEQA